MVERDDSMAKDENIKEEKKDRKLLFNRQVNYMIIQKLWRYIDRKYPNIYKGESLYERVGIQPNAYSRILTANTYQYVNLGKMWGFQNSKLKLFGLSKEIMTGKERIEIDDITIEDWKNYLEDRYGYDFDGKPIEKKEEHIRKSDMAYFNKGIKQSFDKLKEDKKDSRDISKLYYYLKNNATIDEYIPDKEMKDLKAALLQINVNHIEDCESTLRNEVKELLETKLHDTTIILEYMSLKGKK